MSFYTNLSISDAVDAMTDLSMALSTDDDIMGEVNIDDGGYWNDADTCAVCYVEHEEECPELVALLGSM